jgi:glucan biosynthesis protein C
VLLLGFLLVSDDRLDAAVQRLWKWSLAAAGTAVVVLIVQDLGDAGNAAFRGLVEWTMIVGLIGLGRRVVRRPIPWVARFSEISLPFYIWHQTVIIVLAYWVIQWSAGPWVKYLAISVPAFLITWGLSRLVATTRVTRAMFGMR